MGIVAGAALFVAGCVAVVVGASALSLLAEMAKGRDASGPRILLAAAAAMVVGLAGYLAAIIGFVAVTVGVVDLLRGGGS